jgi:hypothetical protein
MTTTRHAEVSSTPSSAFEALKASTAPQEKAKPKSVAIPNYMNKQQEFVLKMAQEAGWVIRSMVQNTKTHKVAIAIEKEGEFAWIASDGALRSEADVVKASGSV